MCTCNGTKGKTKKHRVTDFKKHGQVALAIKVERKGDALWDRFLMVYGYDRHSLTTRVTRDRRHDILERKKKKRGIYIYEWNETKEREREKRKKRGKESGHSMSQRDCRLTGTPVLSNVAFVAGRAFLAATTSLSSLCVEWLLDVTAFVRVVALTRNKSISSVSFDFRKAVESAVNIGGRYLSRYRVYISTRSNLSNGFFVEMTEDFVIILSNISISKICQNL